jgi:hypothetical protein
MTRQNHSYLFREALWTAEGTYRDGEGSEFPVRGETRIRHGADHWFIEGCMRLFGDEKSEFVNNYRVQPFEPSRADTAWTSYNPALGRMEGRFAVVEDMILSHFKSGDGRYSGSECLRKINNHSYRSRGVLFDGEHLLSAWAVNLMMIRGEKETEEHDET